MPRTISFQGRTISVPDNFTDAQVSEVLATPPGTVYAKNEFLSPSQTTGARALALTPFNLGDEINAGLTAGVKALGGAPLSETYEKQLASNRDIQARYAKERPVENFTLGAASAAPVAMMTGGASTVPGMIAQGGAVGAGYGFGAGENLSDRVYNAGVGGVTGAATAGALGGIGRTMQGRTSQTVPDQARLLLDEGVKLTPGQITGGMAAKLENAATSLPLTGSNVANAQQRAVDSFNRAAYNRVLKPLGLSVPDDSPVGREAVDAIHQTASTAYQGLLPRITVNVDNDLVNGLAKAEKTLDLRRPEYITQIKNVVTTVLGSFDNNGAMAGEKMKILDTRLGELVRDYLRSTEADERALGRAIAEVQGALRDNVMRSNPTLAPQLKAANEAWANLVRVEGASGMQGAKQGVFSPAQLGSAVRGKTPDKSQFARGNALMQDLSDAGQAVITKYPDSGTPLRQWVQNPFLAAASTVADVPAYLLSSRPSQNLLAEILAGSRSPAVSYAGGKIKDAAPYASALAAALLAAPNK